MREFDAAAFEQLPESVRDAYADLTALPADQLARLPEDVGEALLVFVGAIDRHCTVDEEDSL